MLMLKIVLFCPFTLVLASLAVNANEKRGLDIKEVEQWKATWKSCCIRAENYCVRNSCYFLVPDKSIRTSVRYSCRGYYPYWPQGIELLQLEKEEDKFVLWHLMQRARLSPIYAGRPVPSSFWTSGVRCRQWDSKKGFVDNIDQWYSGEPFPQWLIDELNVPREASDYDCKFLVVSRGDKKPDLRYEFQTQLNKHAGICQFFAPPDVVTDSPTITTESTTFTTKRQAFSTTDDNDIIHPSEATTKLESTWTSFTTEVYTTQSQSSSSTRNQTTTWIPNISDGLFVGCRERRVEGIRWPDTPPGKTVRRPCPKGTKGTAEWTCDAKTLTFVPEKPRYDNCRHPWIIELEEEVLKGKESVLTMSNRMANKTTSNVLSHGDLSTLVKITGKLLLLYVKQKIEQKLDTGKTPLSYHLTRDVLTSYSHVLRTDTGKAWTDLAKASRVKEASTILKQTATIGHHLSCWKTSSRSDLQYTISKENINLQTFILDSTVRKRQPYVFPELVESAKVPVDVHSKLILPSNVTMKKWPDSYCKDNTHTAVGIIYKRIGQFLETSNDSETIVATPVMSFSLGNESASVNLPDGVFVTIDMKHVGFEQPLFNARCVFWNFSVGAYGDWDDSGCQTLYTNETHTRCSCSHLTNFAVLMDVGDMIRSDDKTLELLTYICCGTSAVALLATVVCLLGLKSLRCRRSSITCNLCFCLFIVDMIILFGLQQTMHEVLCKIIAGTLHFFLLSAFCWMLMEGYHLYNMIVVIFSRSQELAMKYFYCVGYGIPTVIIAFSASLSWQDYGRKDFCWISNRNGLMWSFVGPACAIMLTNLVIFILTMKSALSAKIKKEQDAAKKVKSMLKGSISVMCLLGLTWCVGLLYAVKIFYFSSYVFTVLNALQGVFIFIFHVLFNENAMSSMRVFCCNKTLRRSEKPNRRRVIIQTSRQWRTKYSPTSSVSSLVNGSQGGGQRNDHKRTSATEITSITESLPGDGNRYMHHRVSSAGGVASVTEVYSREATNHVTTVYQQNTASTPLYPQATARSTDRKYSKWNTRRESKENSTINFVT